MSTPIIWAVPTIFFKAIFSKLVCVAADYIKIVRIELGKNGGYSIIIIVFIFAPKLTV